MSDFDNNQFDRENLNEKTVPMQTGSNIYSDLYGDNSGKDDASEAVTTDSLKESSNKTAIIIIAAIAVLVVAGLVMYFVGKKPPEPPVTTVPFSETESMNGVYEEKHETETKSSLMIGEREVLVQNSYMNVFVPYGMIKAKQSENDKFIRYEAARGDRAQIVFYESTGASADAEKYAELSAEKIDPENRGEIYKIKVNGLEFWRLDYGFGLNFYYTDLYNVSGGNLIKINVGSSDRDDIDDIIENSIFKR